MNVKLLLVFVLVHVALVKGQYYDICEQLTTPSDPNEYPIGTKCSQTLSPPDGQVSLLLKTYFYKLLVKIIRLLYLTASENRTKWKYKNTRMSI